jgi:C4-dicarboxylate transporter DctM subunit
MTNTSIVGIFLGGFIPALAMSAILMAVIYWQARRFNWPTDARPSLRVFLAALKNALIPLFVPFVMLVGFRFGIFTATEAGGIIAFYSLVVALLIYRNVTLKEILKVAEESALVSAAVVLLMGAATVYQFLMGMAQVPQAIGRLLMPLQGSPWAFLSVVALIVAFFGMVMEGLPAAVILVPVLFPAAKAMGVQPIHFNIVLTAAVGVGLFMPPIGVGLLIALRFGKLTITQHMPHYWPYAAALAVGLLVVILVPELTMWLPRGAGLAK